MDDNGNQEIKKDEQKKEYEKVAREYQIASLGVATVLATWPTGEPSAIIGGQPKPWTPEAVAAKAHIDVDSTVIVMSLTDPCFIQLLFMMLKLGKLIGIKYNPETKCIAASLLEMLNQPATDEILDENGEDNGNIS